MIEYRITCFPTAYAIASGVVDPLAPDSVVDGNLDSVDMATRFYSLLQNSIRTSWLPPASITLQASIPFTTTCRHTPGLVSPVTSSAGRSSRGYTLKWPLPSILAVRAAVSPLKPNLGHRGPVVVQRMLQRCLYLIAFSDR